MDSKDPSIIALTEEIAILREKLSLLETIISRAPGHIYWKDNDNIYLGCNEKMAKMTGLASRFDIIGKTDFDLPWYEDAHKLNEADQKVMKSGKGEIFEENVYLVDGKEHTFLSEKIPLVNYDNKIIGVLGTSIDITAQKEAEKREKEALIRIIAEQKESETLREKVQTMQILGGTIAHEIRNPLLAINVVHGILEKNIPILLEGYAYALENKASLEVIRPSILKKIPNNLQIIKKEIDASNLFIDTLLSKIKEKLDTKDFEKCLISDCIKVALQRYPFGSQEKRDKVFWRKNDDFFFVGNQTMIIHVLFNLLKNSLYYIGVANKGEISIWIEKDEKYHYLHFKDTGTGMSEEVQAQLFNRFFSQTRYGTGLGLAFCKNVMKSLNGDINCRSIQGDYTEFILSFPIHLS